MNLDFVSGPLLREMVNVKLLERGMEGIRAKYTRLGLPVSDVKDLISEKSPHDLMKDASQAVIEQYMLLDVLPRHLTDPHFRGAYNIPHLMNFVLHPLSVQHDLDYFFERGLRWKVHAKPPEDHEAAMRYANMMLRAGSHHSISQGVFGFSKSLAPFLSGLEDKQLRSLAQSFLYSVSQEHIACSIGVSLAPGSGEEEKFVDCLFDLYLEADGCLAYPAPVLGVGKDCNEGLLAKAHEVSCKSGISYYVNEDLPWQKGSSFVGLERVPGARTGTIHEVTLNLPRLGYEARGDDALLYEILGERLSMAKDILLAKNAEMKKRFESTLDFLVQDREEPYYRLGEANHTIGVVGLNELAKTHVDAELHEDASARKFGLELIKRMSERLGEISKESGLVWAVAQSPSSTRLASSDLGEFGAENTFMYGGTENPYYTAGTHTGDVDMPLDKKIEYEEAFHQLMGGGHVLDIPIRDSKPEALVEQTKKILKRDVGMFTYSRDGKRSHRYVIE